MASKLSYLRNPEYSAYKAGTRKFAGKLIESESQLEGTALETSMGFKGRVLGTTKQCDAQWTHDGEWFSNEKTIPIKHIDTVTI